MARIKASIKKEDLASSSADVWRYKELLPLVDEKNMIPLGEGMTPFVHTGKIGKEIGILISMGQNAYYGQTPIKV